MQATAEQLSHLSIFTVLHAEALSLLAPQTQIKGFQRGEIVFNEGDYLPPKLYAVLTGEIQIQKVSVSGKETVLRWLPPGELFAAPALFGDGIAPATAIALQDCEVVTLEKSALLEAIQSTPEVALQILQCFNQRLQEMHQTIHGLVSERAIVRLARTLQYIAQRYGTKKTKQGVCLTVKLPYQQLARRIGITYEECVRLTNKDLRAIVSYQRGGIIAILDASALDAIASESSTAMPSLPKL
ncbi:Crp/Fnr family transcriptional regulator [Lusitaniella coriacea]|uniref:Crp/Fnr family transcriptional regulator n=1 Tax=Lusitaniella coriacea TaxID=1983105 RepID=UPI003CFB4B36